MTPDEFAERALVGALLNEPARITSIADWLTPDDFADPTLATTFTHLSAMVNEARAAVRWGTVEMQAGDSSTRPELTDAEQAYRHAVDAADTLDLGKYEPEGADPDWARRAASRIAQDAARFPGLLDRLEPGTRHNIDFFLSLTTVNAHAVAGVTPEALATRISAAVEPGAQVPTPATLTALAQTAPPSQLADPHRYGLIVLEASIRRQVENAGLQVAKANRDFDLNTTLATVDTALDQLAQAQQRWEALTRPTLAAVLEPVGGEALPGTVMPALAHDRPTTSETRAAEHAVIADILRDPAVVGELAQRLQPGDFADPAIGNTYRAAVELHTAGEHLDMVTLAAHQHRHELQHGPGMRPEQLLAAAAAPPDASPRDHAGTVLRGTLSRLIDHAAQTVRDAAAHPGLQPDDVLATSTMVYEAVQRTAQRAGVRQHPAALAALAAPVSIEDALNDRQPRRQAPSGATVTPLRPRTGEREAGR